MSAARDESVAVGRVRVGSNTHATLISGFDVHRVGVTIEKDVDRRTWYEFGKLLQQINYARDWIIADWLAFGEHKYGDKIYQSAARLLGKAPRTWEDYAYIARNVRVSERSEILPTLVHRPIARFGDKPAMQRELIALAEEHTLSKAIFEHVIELYLAKKPFKHLLVKSLPPVERARIKARKDRERVLRQARHDGSEAWIAYVREQAQAWREVMETLEQTRAKAPRGGTRPSASRGRSSGYPAH